MLVAKEVAKKMNINDAFNIVINNGKDAGQTVFHLHIHLLAGKNFSELLPG
jgi:histidine triad (HIT) family protein